MKNFMFSNYSSNDSETNKTSALKNAECVLLSCFVELLSLFCQVHSPLKTSLVFFTFKLGTIMDNKPEINFCIAQLVD